MGFLSWALIALHLATLQQGRVSAWPSGTEPAHRQRQSHPGPRLWLADQLCGGTQVTELWLHLGPAVC